MTGASVWVQRSVQGLALAGTTFLTTRRQVGRGRRWRRRSRFSSRSTFLCSWIIESFSRSSFLRLRFFFLGVSSTLKLAFVCSSISCMARSVLLSPSDLDSSTSLKLLIVYSTIVRIISAVLSVFSVCVETSTDFASSSVSVSSSRSS
uniref:(northern house mosquito) hypothetical protein n=1 Tax=Culex pipiens TaxID=7175 RepID=A0A8D8FLA2_CULPI